MWRQQQQCLARGVPRRLLQYRYRKEARKPKTFFFVVVGQTKQTWCSFRKYTLELYDRPSAPLEVKIRMLRAEVLQTMLYGSVTWSRRACHYDTLRRAHHRFLTRCTGWRKHNRADHPISYLDRLIKTGSESIEVTYAGGGSCSRDLLLLLLLLFLTLFAGFVARTVRPGGSVDNLDTFWRWDVNSNLSAVTLTEIFLHKKMPQQVEND